MTAGVPCWPELLESLCVCFQSLWLRPGSNPRFLDLDTLHLLPSGRLVFSSGSQQRWTELRVTGTQRSPTGPEPCPGFLHRRQMFAVQQPGLSGLPARFDSPTYKPFSGQPAFAVALGRPLCQGPAPKVPFTPGLLLHPSDLPCSDVEWLLEKQRRRSTFEVCRQLYATQNITLLPTVTFASRTETQYFPVSLASICLLGFKS